jgi:hypothetical protein
VNDEKLLEFFSKLGEGDLTEMFQQAEEFVFKIYGNKNKKITSLDNDDPARRRYGLNTTRAHYVAKMCRRAGVPMQS